ncbi:MAG: hypothetical protein WCJ94_04710 [bacterium]
MKKILFGFIILLSSYVSVYSNHISILLPDITTAASIGISGACGAKAADLNSLMYNPAAISGINSYKLMFTYNSNSIINSSSTLTTILVPLFNDMAFALSYVFDRQSGIIDIPYGISDLSRYNSMISIAYALALTESIKCGATFKYLESNIIASRSTHMGFDAGAVFGGDSNLTGSIAILDIAGPVTYAGTESLLANEIMPFRFGVGFNYDAYCDDAHFLAFSIDGFYHVNEIKYDVSLGLKYVYKNLLTIRIGDKLDIYGSDFLSWGTGLNYNFYGVDVRIDYACLAKLTGAGNRGSSNVLSMLVSF